MKFTCPALVRSEFHLLAKNNKSREHASACRIPAKQPVGQTKPLRGVRAQPNQTKETDNSGNRHLVRKHREEGKDGEIRAERGEDLKPSALAIWRS